MRLSLAALVLTLIGLAICEINFELRDIEQFVERPAFCANIDYKRLPNATVVITVLNEEMWMIEANVKSILAKTPPDLLDSIIVVDDYSEFLPISSSILELSPKVQLIRTDSPKGVAGARMIGAERGKGEVLVFLDSQMEVTDRWLHPLLSYVSTHPRSVAASIIDKMYFDGSFVPRQGMFVVSVIPERLAFCWTTEVQNASQWAVHSPVLLGSAFAIKRSWFEEGGKYDPGNRVWGIENIELSVRVWTCGEDKERGDIVFMPCSRVGHYFRDNRTANGRKESSRFDSDFLITNSIRFAEVWMDEYADTYFAGLEQFHLTPEYIKGHRDSPDLAERKALRKNLKCKSFDWYYKNIVEALLTKYNAINDP